MREVNNFRKNGEVSYSFLVLGPYSKHKRKFARFNRTAPMPIDVLMQDKTKDSKNREVSKYSTKSEYTFVVGAEYENRPRNYLTRRPATAPSKFNLSSVKGER